MLLYEWTREKHNTQSDQTPAHILQDCSLFTAQKNQAWPEGADLNTKTPAHILQDCSLFTAQRNQTWPQCGQTSAHILQDYPLFTAQKNKTWPEGADLNTKTSTHPAGLFPLHSPEEQDLTWRGRPQHQDLNTSCRTVPSSQPRGTRPDLKGQTSTPSCGGRPLTWNWRSALWYLPS